MDSKLAAGSIAGLASMLGALLPLAEGAATSEAATASSLGENGAASDVGVAEPAGPAALLDGVAVPPAFFFAWNFFSCIK